MLRPSFPWSGPFSKLVWAFALLVCAPLWADPNDYLHNRTYLGFLGTSVSVDRSTLFNGSNYSLVNGKSYEVDLIPALDQNFGWGGMIGHREEAWAVELGYWQSEHKAVFGPGVIASPAVTVLFSQYQDAAVYRSVNLDFKRYLFTDLQSQPFIQLGVCFPWITVPSAAEDGAGNVGSLSLAGLGLALGVGLEYYLSPNFSVVGSASQRWASFDQFRGLAGQYAPLAPYGGVSNDSGGGFVFTLGTTVGFQTF